jgi:uncharacterized protein DUF1186/SEC-C motif-containing protein
MNDVAAMSPEEVKRVLEYNSGKFPFEAVSQAVAQREALTPMLLAELERAADSPQALLDEPESYMLHVYAMYLLAQFREPRALDPLLRLFSLTGDAVELLLGDVVTEDGGALLASVCHGEVAPIKALIENREANEYGRDAGICALLTLVAEGDLDRGELIDYLRQFSRTLGPEDFLIQAFWVAAADELYPEELMPEIRAVYAAGAVDDSFIALRDLDRTLKKGREAALASLRENRRYLTDAIGALSAWACFNEEVYLPGPEDQDDDDDGGDDPRDPWLSPPVTYVRETPKVGRNDPCPCGSGKKYKRCCMPA